MSSGCPDRSQILGLVGLVGRTLRVEKLLVVAVEQLLRFVLHVVAIEFDDVKGFHYAKEFLL